MSPGADTVARTRWAVRVALRLALLVVLLLSAWALYREIGAWRTNTQRIQQLRGAGRGTGGGPSVFLFISTTWSWLMIAALLLAADLFALRLLVPAPRGGCPGCGYDVDPSKQERCPECGLALSSPAGRKEERAEASV